MLDARPADAAPDGTPTTLLAVKAVPGARRDQIVGPLGDRLKVRVSAPPEGGKANKAICTLLARALDLKPARVAIHAGASSPEKTVRIEGLDPAEVRKRLAPPGA
ncbi:MAG: DUF167 domain-containing protein [Phycisphaeraceae bacterium]|nr:MAG: DUF167 domain-containing protein [Phycisphaeraceae bacterium]